MTQKITTRYGNEGDATAEYHDRIAQLNLRGAKVAAILAVTLVPLFSVLDYFVLTELFTSLLVFRAAVGLYCLLVLYLITRPNAARHAYFYSSSEVVVVALAIAVMVHLHDALRPEESPSHYYAGIILVVVAAGQLFRWTLRQAVTTFTIIYLGYLVPSLILQPPADKVLYLSNNFFLLSTMIIAVVAHYFGYNLQLREFLASFDLEAANRQLEDANTKLTEMDKFKSQFFSNITHELRTPLTLILAPTEAIINGEMGRFNPNQQEYFKRIFQNGLKLMKLINDLLDLSKLEDSKLRLRVGEMDAKEFVKGLADNIRPLAERKQVELTFSETPGDAVVWADPDRLERVFINLLANAVKFTEEGGTINVHVDLKPDKVHVRVKDTGIGIPADKLDMIFDRFSQIDGTATRKFGGTGIGLALARELTELHGGQIWADSRLNEGTTMHVVLHKGRDHFRPEVLDRRQRKDAIPGGRRQEDGALPQWSNQFREKEEYKYLDIEYASDRRMVPRRSDPVAGDRAATVLVVEDSREMAQFIELQLRDRYKVFVAENGRKGWELVQKAKPDLIITDYMMPEMDGLELTGLVKGNQAYSHIPVVLLTAKTAASDRVAGREAGADAYLAKPFSTSELLALVKARLKTSEEHADRLLTQRMDSLEIIAARLVHEIHNPLNYIKNGAFLARKSFNRLIGLQGEDDTPENRAKTGARVEKMLSQIEVGTSRITSSVELLQEYAREGYSRVLRAYDVDEGVEKVLSVVVSAEGTNRSVHFAPSGAGEIECVPQEFHEIVSNFLQNAIDATGVGGTIRVDAVRDGDEVVISVKDDGDGIAPDVLDKVFSPFFTTKEPGKGMGMGLTITYRLVKKYGGRIDVHSEVGKGTTFVVKLPVRQPRSRAEK